MAIENFTNDAATTVSTGGTTAPAPGTVQTWTVASSASFPTAGNAGVFHVADPALPNEVILVTSVSGTTWTVTRGAEGTTTYAHTGGFTVRLVLTAGTLGNFVQYLQPSGDTTGATDTAVINAIAAQLWNAGGGTIQLAAGYFYITQILVYSGVTYRGVGRGEGSANAQSAVNKRLGTILVAPIGNTTDMFAFASLSGVPSGWVIRDLMLWGQNGTTWGSPAQSTAFHGLNLTGVSNIGGGTAAMPKQGYVENLLIREVPGDSITVAQAAVGNGSMDGSEFVGIQIQFAGRYGVNLQSGVSDVHLARVEVETSGDCNFMIAGSHAILTNCKANSAGQLALGAGHEDGFSLSGSTNMLEGVEAENCGQGAAGTHGNGFGVYAARNRIRGISATPVQCAVYLGSPSNGISSATAQYNDIDVTICAETANSQPAQQLILDATVHQPVNNEVHMAGILPVPITLNGSATLSGAGYIRAPIEHYPAFVNSSGPVPGVSGTYGTPITVSPTAGFGGLGIYGCYWNNNGVVSENITLQIVATYEDATTATVTLPATAGNAATQTLSASNLKALEKAGHYITSFTVASTSSAGSTTATPQISFVGLNL